VGKTTVQVLKGKRKKKKIASGKPKWVVSNLAKVANA
jgi:hypothetical protein